MNTSYLVVFPGVALLFAVYGCRDTEAGRMQISQRTTNLTAAVKANPESKEGRAAMTELIDILNGNWTFASCQACYAFDELGPLASPAVPHLIKAARSNRHFISQDAVRGLRSIGPAAAPAVEFLMAIVNDQLSRDSEIASLRATYAVEALGNIGADAISAIPLLERAAQSRAKLFSSEAKKALIKLRTIKEKSGNRNEAK